MERNNSMPPVPKPKINTKSKIIQKQKPKRKKLQQKIPSNIPHQNTAIHVINYSRIANVQNTSYDRYGPNILDNKNELTPKQRSYLMSTYYTKSSRYAKLKAMAFNAIQKHHVYQVSGSYRAVKKALNSRGWIERLSSENRHILRLQNLRKAGYEHKEEFKTEIERLMLSDLVSKHTPNLIWKLRHSGVTLNNARDKPPIINKLKMDTAWTSKLGLCSSIKDANWFYSKDLVEVNSPRTYTSSNKEEEEEFKADFKITACTSLLKWLLIMTNAGKPIFTEDGTISYSNIVFALRRCREYVFEKQNKDIDYNLTRPSLKKWMRFLNNYNKLLLGSAFRKDPTSKVSLYIGYATIILCEIFKFRPQLHCEGLRNIWIVKPGHCSRGRGIRLASRLENIGNLFNKTRRYVIQKYIEEPLLIYETKFDIRQYYLVTSTYPLVIWMYKDCYLKFSSQKYSLMSYHESIHLTNNAIQRKYKNCKGRHPQLPNDNMWSLKRFQEYLICIEKPEIWDSIYKGMIKCIIGIMLSCQEGMSPCKNRFEIYGCDFILDKDYNPWLIEINSAPDMAPTTPVTAAICPAVMEDTIKVVIDNGGQSRTFSATGNFECVFKQVMTTSIVSNEAATLTIQGSPLPTDYFTRTKLLIDEPQYDHIIKEDCDLDVALKELENFYSSHPTKSLVTSSNCGNESLELLPIELADERISDQDDNELAIIDPSSDSSINSPNSSLETFSLEDEKKTLSSSSSVTSGHLSITGEKTKDENSSSYFSEMKIYEMGSHSIQGINVSRKFKSENIITRSRLHDEIDSTDNNLERIINDISVMVSRSSDSKYWRPIEQKGISHHTVIRPYDSAQAATTKMLNFIHNKQKEYERIVPLNK